MKFVYLETILALISLTDARRCRDITASVSITAQNYVFNIQAPTTNIEVTDFVLNVTQPKQPPFVQTVITGVKAVGGTYKLAGTFCHPDRGQSDTVQLLTHGVGFDRSYWDYPFHNSNYSYTAAAVDHFEYSTFSWDRLGIGMSQHGDPISEIQATLEVEALHALTTLLRDGKLPSCEKPFKNVVHVGHSFGSSLTYALTQKYPTDSDGIALTGFSQDTTSAGDLLLGGHFVSANTTTGLRQYPNGYLAIGDASGWQIVFFAPRQFDPAILTLAVKTAQPVAIGQLLTIGVLTTKANSFGNPVLVTTGERDIPFCGGNCFLPTSGYPSIPAAAAKTLPNARNFTTIIVPNAGHGLNLEYSHPFTYKSINDYFDQNVDRR